MNDHSSDKGGAVPYAPYATFKAKIRSLAEANGTVPSHVDKSVLSGMSGSAQTALLGALKWFDLTSDDGESTETLQQMAAASDEEWKSIFGAMIREKYSDHLPALANGTPQKLKDTFDGKVGSTLIPNAIRFLAQASHECGIPVSPQHIKVKGATTQSTSKKRIRKRSKGGAGSRGRVQPLPPPHVGSFKDQLLAKFPAFNPDWPDEQKTAWFESYQKLLSMVPDEKTEGTED